MTDTRHRHWRVSVETSGEHIVSIEPETLAGREISEADEDAVRTAAHHLLAFIGDPAPQTKKIGGCTQDLRGTKPGGSVGPGAEEESLVTIKSVHPEADVHQPLDLVTPAPLTTEDSDRG